MNETPTYLVPFFREHVRTEGGPAWWCVGCSANARTMCFEECVEVNGPEQCGSAGGCQTRAPRPPRKPRKIVYSERFIDSMLDLCYSDAFIALDEERLV